MKKRENPHRFLDGYSILWPGCHGDTRGEWTSVLKSEKSSGFVLYFAEKYDKNKL